VRFELVDRIHEIHPQRSIRASKVASRAETFWVGHHDDLRMPAVLVLESLCQAGAWLVNASTQGSKRAALGSIGSFRVLGDVRPGDILELTGEIVSMNEEGAVLSGAATVGGTPVLTADEILCVLLPADRLEDPATTARRLRQLQGGLE